MEHASTDPVDEPEPTAGNHTKRSRTLVALATAVVVILVASVALSVTRSGSHGDDGFSINALAASTQRASARVTIRITVPTSVSPGQPSGTPSQFAFVETGLVDFRRRVARIEIEDPNSRGAPKQIGTELLINGHTYSSITAANAAPIPPEIRRTKRWLRLAPRKSSNSFTSLNPFDPLAQLREHHVTLKDLGITQLGGQAVHRYEGTEHFAYSPSSIGPRETLTVTFDIYVDSHDRLVRLTSATEQPGVAEAARTQIDFSDYGVRVNVTAPPPNEVYVLP